MMWQTEDARSNPWIQSQCILSLLQLFLHVPTHDKNNLQHPIHSYTNENGLPLSSEPHKAAHPCKSCRVPVVMHTATSNVFIHASITIKHTNRSNKLFPLLSEKSCARFYPWQKKQHSIKFKCQLLCCLQNHAETCWEMSKWLRQILLTSEMGVSMTRLSPYFFQRPLLTCMKYWHSTIQKQISPNS